MTPASTRNGEAIVSPWVGKNWHHLLITDVDNTLFDFGLYAEAGLRNVLQVTCRLLDISEQQAKDELRAAFRAFNSIEVPFAYEALPSLIGASEQFRLETSRKLAQAFWVGASAGMQPYTDVASTMEHLWRSGTAIVAVSDAPMWEVGRKLRRLGIYKYFAGVSAVRVVTRRRTATLRHHHIEDYRRPLRTQTRFYRLLTDADRKPSPQAYQHVLAEIPVPHERVTVVGDSPLKDLEPARAIGLTGYWASYGERNRHLETLLKTLTPFEPPEAVSSQAAAAKEFPRLDSFSQLTDVIEPTQLRLPLGAASTR